MASENKGFKCVLLGEAGVGKTCIVNRYIKGAYLQGEATIGSSYQSKVESVSLENQEPTNVKLQIWDTAGSEQFRSLTSIYYKNAACVILVYDSTNSVSFEGLNFWVQELEQQQILDSVIVSVVASKVDASAEEQVGILEASEFVTKV